MIWDILRRIFYRVLWRIYKPKDSKYKIYVESIGVKLYPKVASVDETIEELISNRKSIARFGDGEFMLCFGRSINFQQSNRLLRKRLRMILRNDNPSCIVGLPEYNPIYNTPFWRQFWYENTLNITCLLNKNTSYFNQGISRLINLKQIDRLKHLWDGRNVIFVFGKGSRFDVNHEVFCNIDNKYIIECLAKNAWSEYNPLYQKTLNLASSVNNPLVICSLGPTATILTYDLSKKMQAIDLGHLTNVYDVLKYGADSPEKLHNQNE